MVAKEFFFRELTRHVEIHMNYLCQWGYSRKVKVHKLIFTGYHILASAREQTIVILTNRETIARGRVPVRVFHF